MPQPRTATNLIVIHCSATPARMQIGAREIDTWHRNKGWSGCGYHVVIRRDGLVESAHNSPHVRALERIGAHAAPYNRHSLGVCLVGGIDEHGRAQDNFSALQYRALASTLDWLLSTYPNIACIVGHGALPGVRKACPSFDAKHWLGIRGYGQRVRLDYCAHPAPGARTHIVEPGDTLYALARRARISVTRLRAANPGVSAASLRIGQRLTLPAPEP